MSRPSTKGPWKHVTWRPSRCPAGVEGRAWVASYGGRHLGAVVRLREGRFEAWARGRQTYYGPSMREAAKRVVAHVNGLYPSQIT